MAGGVHGWVGVHGRGCAWLVGGMCGQGSMCGQRGACVAGGVPGKGTWMVGGACVAGGMAEGHASHAPPLPPMQILWLWHMVNELAVRIILECILVQICVRLNLLPWPDNVTVTEVAVETLRSYLWRRILIKK